MNNKNIDLGPGEAFEPVRCFENWTLAPSRMTFVDDEEHPWYGNLYVAGLRSKHVRSMEINEGDIVSEKIFYMNRESPYKGKNISRRFRDIEFYNNSLWVMGDKNGLLELSPAK